MIIKRKLFTQPTPYTNQVNNPLMVQQEPVTSKDLLEEQMKLQRQLMITNRMRQKMQAEERQEEMKRISQIQKAEAKRDEQESENRIRTKRVEAQSGEAVKDNTSLYKTRSKPVTPVPMKS